MTREIVDPAKTAAVDAVSVEEAVEQAVGEDESAPLDPGARVEVRRIERKQVFVDGKPVGEPFE